MSEVRRWGELDEATFETKLVRKSSSYILFVTRAAQMMSLKEGDMVRVKLEKIKREE